MLVERVNINIEGVSSEKNGLVINEKIKFRK